MHAFVVPVLVPTFGILDWSTEEIRSIDINRCKPPTPRALVANKRNHYYYYSVVLFLLRAFTALPSASLCALGMCNV